MKKSLVLLLILASTSAFAQLSLNKDNVEEIISALTNEEKATLIIGSRYKTFNGVGYTDLIVKGAAGTTGQVDRLGIPAVVLADGPAGVRIQDRTCTKFPIGTSLASTWDPALVEEVGASIGNEVKEYGVDVLLAPGINLHRNPLCGRNFEYYSEDPVLAGKIAAAYVRGVQSQGVGTSVKHFAANNQELNRLFLDVRADERTLRELYLRNFEIAVKEGEPWTVMTSYNFINGCYSAENGWLVNDVLRGEWGFKGAVMTDWGGGYDNKAIVLSGNDMIQPGNDKRYNEILAGMNDGSLPMEAVDAAVRNVLNLVLRSPRFAGYEYSNKPELEKHSEVTRRAAADGIVLLKNGKGKKAPLPFAADEKVALFGVASYAFITGGTGSGDVNGTYTIDLKQGLTDGGFILDEAVDAFYTPYMEYEKTRCAKIDKDNHRRGWFVDAERPLEVLPTDVIASAAKTADKAVITIGRVFGEGKDRNLQTSYMLSKDELALIKAVSEAFRKEGKQLVVVLDTGGIVDMSWTDYADGIMYCWLPGCEAGHSICDVISGKVSPSGRLPMSITRKYSDDPTAESMPQPLTDKYYNYSFFRTTYGKENKRYEIPGVDYVDYTEGVFMGYRYYVTKGVKVAYPFGYGLSYTSFKYSDMSVSRTDDGNLEVTVTVTNVGKVAGKEVVQLYVHAPGKDMAKPKRELKGFTKTAELQPGESATVSIPVAASLLDSWSDEGWVRERGRYTFLLCSNASKTIIKKHRWI